MIVTGALVYSGLRSYILFMESTQKGYALITGGGSGLGLEMAKLLAARSYPLILCGRRKEVLASGAQECLTCGAPKVKIIPCDLVEEGAIERLAEEVSALCTEEDTPLEILVNNAGRGLFGPVIKQNKDDLAAMIKLNIESLANMCRLFVPMLTDRGKGNVLNVGSLAGGQPMPFFAGYGATKSFVHTFTLALRAELYGSGVSVTLLEPGFIRTGFDVAAGIESQKYRSFSFRKGMSADRVARSAVRALLAGKARVIPGFGNQISAFFGALLSDTFLATIMRISVMGLTGKKE